jgi:hypothetical protein
MFLTAPPLVHIVFAAMPIPLSLPNLAHAIWRIMTPAIDLVWAHGKRHGSPEDKLALAMDRIRRVMTQLRLLVARANAGTLPRPRAKRPRDAAKPPIDHPEGWEPKPRAKSKWPREFAWITKLVGSGMAMSAASGLEWLIANDAEMQLLMQAAGPQVVRLARSLFWALGATLPPCLRKPEVMIPVPPDYRDGTRKVKGGALTFTRHANLVMQGWRAPGPPPKRKPRKPSAAVLARREERRQLREARAKVIAWEKEKLSRGGRPRPRSLILGI